MKSRYFIITILFCATKACGSDKDTAECTSSGGSVNVTQGGSPAAEGGAAQGGAPTQSAGAGGDTPNAGGTQTGTTSEGGSAGNAGAAAVAGGSGGTADAGAGGEATACPTSVHYELANNPIIGTCAGDTCSVENDSIVSYCGDRLKRSGYGCEVSMKLLTFSADLSTASGIITMRTAAEYTAAPIDATCDASNSVQAVPSLWKLTTLVDGVDSKGCATYSWQRNGFTVGSKIATSNEAKPARVSMPLPTCYDQTYTAAFDGFATNGVAIQVTSAR